MNAKAKIGYMWALLAFAATGFAAFCVFAPQRPWMRHRIELRDRSNVWGVGISPQTDVAYLACGDGAVHAVTLKTLECTEVFRLKNQAMCTSIGKIGEALIVGDSGGGLHRFDLRTGDHIASQYSHNHRVIALGIVGEDRIASGPNLGPGSGIGGDDLSAIDRFATDPNGIWSIAVTPDQRTIACANYDSVVSVFDAATRERRAFWSAGNGIVWSLQFVDNSILVAACGDSFLRAWNTQSTELLEQFKVSNESLYCLSYAPQRALLAVGDGNGVISVFDWPGLNLRWQFRTHQKHLVSKLNFVREGKELLVVTQNQKAGLDDLRFLSVWRIP